MSTSTVHETRTSLLDTLLSDEAFRPAEPASLEEAGLPASLIESLVCKYLTIVGTTSGRAIADHLCLPFGMLEGVFHDLRTRQIIVHTGSAPLSDYSYALTEQGRARAQTYLEACAYVGPGAGAAGRLRAVGRSPNDPGRSAQARRSSARRFPIFRSTRPVREPGPGHQLRRRAVLVRHAGQRQVDAGQAHHDVLRPANLDSARADRRRPAHQALRRRLPRSRSKGRRGEHRCGRPASTAAGSRSAGPRSWSAAS